MPCKTYHLRKGSLHFLSKSEAPVIGQTIGHYKILEKIGEGGRGCILEVVYLYSRLNLGRRVSQLEGGSG